MSISGPKTGQNLTPIRTPKSDQKRPKTGPKRSKKGHFPGSAENGPKWPKMAKKGSKWPKKALFCRFRPKPHLSKKARLKSRRIFGFPVFGTAPKTGFGAEPEKVTFWPFSGFGPDSDPIGHLGSIWGRFGVRTDISIKRHFL